MLSFMCLRPPASVRRARRTSATWTKRPQHRSSQTAGWWSGHRGVRAAGAVGFTRWPEAGRLQRIVRGSDRAVFPAHSLRRGELAGQHVPRDRVAIVPIHGVDEVTFDVPDHSLIFVRSFHQFKLVVTLKIREPPESGQGNAGSGYGDQRV